MCRMLTVASRNVTAPSPMSFEAFVRAIAPKLRQIACKYRTAGPYTDEDDLYGVMLANLWERWNNGVLEGKTESYIVQSCYFYLRNYLRTTRETGRCVSLDESAGNAGGDDTPRLEEVLPDDSRDMPAVIEGNVLYDKIMSNGLLKVEKDIVRLLCDGYSVREVGKMLRMSHAMVIKHKKHIAQKVSSRYGFLLV